MGDEQADGGAPSVPLPPERDGEAVALLAAAGVEAEPAALIAAFRADPEVELYVVVKGGALVAVYGLRKEGLTLELRPLAATTAWEEWLALKDAVARAGKRPVVVEATEGQTKTFRQFGFRVVSRRRGADGAVRYRLGWHVPTRQHPT